MKFVNDKDGKKSATISEPVQLGNEETKQPEEVKPVEPHWQDGITTTLVNMRKEPTTMSKALFQIRGGEIVKINVSFVSSNFKQVKYAGEIGYIKEEYVKKI